MCATGVCAVDPDVCGPCAALGCSGTCDMLSQLTLTLVRCYSLRLAVLLCLRAATPRKQDLALLPLALHRRLTQCSLPLSQSSSHDSLPRGERRVPYVAGGRVASLVLVALLPAARTDVSQQLVSVGPTIPRQLNISCGCVSCSLFSPSRFMKTPPSALIMRKRKQHPDPEDGEDDGYTALTVR